MRKPGKMFGIGERFGGRIVLAVTKKSPQLEGIKYRVEYDICAHEGEIGHRALLRTPQTPGICATCNRILMGMKTGKVNITKRTGPQVDRITYRRGSPAWAIKHFNKRVPSLSVAAVQRVW